MNLLKLKKIVFTLTAIITATIFLSSCEKDIIQEQPTATTVTLAEVNPQERQIKQLGDTNSNLKIRCSNFESLANASLTNLVGMIRDYAEIPEPEYNKDRIVIQYNYYRTEILERCLPEGTEVPEIILTEEEQDCEFTAGGFCFDGSAAINALEFFLCHLNNFLINPNDFGNQQNLSNAFEYYIFTLDFCFRTDLEESLRLNGSIPIF